MTTTSLPSESGFDPRAQELFFAFCERIERGEKPDFEALCAAHRELEGDLREMRSLHLFADTLGKHAANDEADSELLRRLRGSGARDTRYRVLGKLAEGGMGAILRIWDDELRRTLAMKVILGNGERASGDTPDVDPKTLGRFLEEAQITGQLDHPGIVPVHELGLDAAGRVYFTMKLVKGEDLKAVFEHVHTGHKDWNQVRALNVMLRVCEAVAFAHSKNVVHRDLKPANVMVGKFGEVYVMDWGLARVLGREDKHDLRLRPEAPTSASVVRTERREQRDSTPDSPLVTMDGDVVGTPSYMPPEQARGQLDKLGPHSDVYSIGAMLYQLVTGRLPYVPAEGRVSQHTILAAVLRGPPEPLESLAPRTPPELVAIIEKAMEREIAARYPTTSALADDLRAYLDGRVVAAYETGVWAETRKWVQRNKPLAASLAAAAVALVGGIAFSMNFARETEAANVALSQKTAELERRNSEIDRQRNELARTNTELRAASREAKLRGMVQDLARLRAQSRTLDGLGRLGKPAYLWWIEESEKLLSGQEEDDKRSVEWRPGLKDVRATLAELRSDSSVLPYTDDDAKRDFDSHPDRQLLRNLEAQATSGERAADRETLEQRCRERRTWRFNDSSIEWTHNLLATLEADLRWQAQMLAVAKEAAFSEKAKARWTEAIEAISRAPKYAGQKWPSGERLTPQLGLLPLGENPATGLWEFVHLQTGTEPALGPDGRVLRDSEGRLTLKPETGMVFVLLPGGRVPKADSPDQSQEEWMAEFDLDPFFLSKYEMTREQWDRVSTRRGFHHKSDTPLIPANCISWDDITEMLRRELGGGSFPSAVQWEYGCRANTATMWWPGNDPSELVGVANIDHDPDDDNKPAIMRVGALRANAFGLHDVHGNVREWYGDSWPTFSDPRPGDGLVDDGLQRGPGALFSGEHWVNPDSVGVDMIVDDVLERGTCGGGWRDREFDSWVTVDFIHSPNWRTANIGLRPAKFITP